MKLEVKYRFPTSSSDAYFYIYELSEALEMKKIVAHGTRMQRIHKPGNTFSRFSQSYAGPGSNLHTRTEISSMASLTPKIVY